MPETKSWGYCVYTLEDYNKVFGNFEVNKTKVRKKKDKEYNLLKITK